ncbi:MAG TPA: hypothetical protein VJX66_06545 [Amycolatopsis sp.]|nr:hypothetical protein [Amycolatopsis sp.]
MTIRISKEEFGELFDSFEHTAFRLEVRERYNVSYEQEHFRRFLAGSPDPDERRADYAKSWHVMLRRVRAAGCTFRRVRVVSLPPSDYNRYGLWSSQFTVADGDDIRYLDRAKASPELPDHDFWLFDSRTLVRMNFDEDDRPLRHEIVEDPAEIVKHNYWRDVAWHHAVKREDFATAELIGLG